MAKPTIPSPKKFFAAKKRAVAQGRFHDPLELTTDPNSALALARTARRMYFHKKYGGKINDLEVWIECAAHATHLPVDTDKLRAALVRELASASVALQLISRKKLAPPVWNRLKNNLLQKSRYDYREALHDLLTRDRAVIEAEIKSALKGRIS